MKIIIVVGISIALGIICGSGSVYAFNHMPDEWLGTDERGREWQRVKSVVVFGRVEFIEDYDRVVEISRSLSHRFTQDDAYIDDEIRHHARRTLVCAVNIEHMTGKTVNER